MKLHCVSETYVCTNPALFRRSLLLLRKKPFDFWKKPSNLQKKCSDLWCRCTANAFHKNVPNVSIIFFDRYCKCESLMYLVCDPGPICHVSTTSSPSVLVSILLCAVAFHSFGTFSPSNPFLLRSWSILYVYCTEWQHEQIFSAIWDGMEFCCWRCIFLPPGPFSLRLVSQGEEGSRKSHLLAHSSTPKWHSLTIVAITGWSLQ